MVARTYIGWVAHHCYEIALYFHEIGKMVNDWVWPFSEAAHAFFSISSFFDGLKLAFVKFDEWTQALYGYVHGFGIWDWVKYNLVAWLPGLEDAITVINNFTDEVKTFIADPILYLKTKFRDVILPWAINNIPWVGTIYRWYMFYSVEIDLFFSNPIQYLKTKFEYDILPWAISDIPFIRTLYIWYSNFKIELELFFTDPSAYLKRKFEEVILPWAIESIPFFFTLYRWYETIEIDEFFTDPLGWLWERFTNWFLGKE